MFNMMKDFDKGESAAKMVFPDDKFRDLFDKLAADTDEEIQRGIDEVVPHIVALMINDDDKKTMAQATLSELPEDFDERQELLHMVGAKLVEESRSIPMAIFAVSEAWMWEGSNPEDAFSSYEEHGERNRSEIIILSGQTLDDRILTQVYVVTRGDENVIILERKLPLITGNNVGGEHNNFITAIYEGGAMWMMGQIVKNVKDSGKTFADLAKDDTVLEYAIDHVFDKQKGDNSNGHLN